MDAGSLKQRTAFSSSIQVHSSFPPIPDFKSRISMPESGPCFTELNRSDTPIPPLPFDPATLTTPKKRGRSMTEEFPAHKPKKSKGSNKSVARQVTPPEEPGRNHRRLGDLREIDQTFFQVGLIHSCSKFRNLIFNNSPHVRNSLQRNTLYDR
jgi:hypothetical protein